MRVVATAGHVDHGKSSLVLALTGTDPDRFAEEKARGLTIDLGFAFTTLPSGTEVGFVDVPGHVRFLKNMLAGVGAVEVALFVVAATEGWMPQSEEHLRILELLGVRHGVVAVTKADLVDDDLLELALLDVQEHLAGSPLRDAPVVACDSLSRRGLDDLVRALDEALADAPMPRDDDRPRLWVDRVFAARGAGTVVTGTLVGGGVAVDDELTVARLDERVRVRGIESAHRRLDRVGPGSRVALNLVGVDHHELRRGDALVRAGQWCITSAVDVALQPVGSAPLPTRGRWQAYVGSGEHGCRWRAFGVDGATGARVTFTEPLALAPGDRLVLRDPGRGETVAGAVVLDAEAPGRIEDAAARAGLPLGARLVTARGWVSRATIPPLAGCSPAEAEVLAATTVAAGDAVALDDWLVDPTVLARAQRSTRDAVAALHREQPLARGLELTVLADALRVDPHRARLVATTLDDVVVEQGLVRDAARTMAVAESPEAIALVASLDASPFTPPEPADVALARALVREGVLVDVNGVVFTRRALDAARRLLAERLANTDAVTVADVRELLGSTRKYVVPLMEWFDARGVTRRRGDTRVAGPRLGTPLSR